jgi:hypothetical protein
VRFKVWREHDRPSFYSFSFGGLSMPLNLQVPDGVHRRFRQGFDIAGATIGSVATHLSVTLHPQFEEG